MNFRKLVRLNYTTNFKWNYLKKKGSAGISKIHAVSRHDLLSESVKISGVFVFKTYFIAEVKSCKVFGI